LSDHFLDGLTGFETRRRRVLEDIFDRIPEADLKPLLRAVRDDFRVPAGTIADWLTAQGYQCAKTTVTDYRRRGDLDRWLTDRGISL
jgi:hypothetical protein